MTIKRMFQMTALPALLALALAGCGGGSGGGSETASSSNGAGAGTGTPTSGASGSGFLAQIMALFGTDANSEPVAVDASTPDRSDNTEAEPVS